MILYTLTGSAANEGFLNLAESDDLTGKNVYVNMTNRCPCSCVFCLRQTKQMLEGSDLWLRDGEPEVETVLGELSRYDLSAINELVFCGFGEPTERLPDICRVVDSVKKQYPGLRTRLNTNGLANLIHGRDMTPELAGRFDTVSVSLNAPDAGEYLALTRSKFGIGSFDAVKEFAASAKRYVPDVVMTVVDHVMPEDKIEICRRLCGELGVRLRVRTYDSNGTDADNI